MASIIHFKSALKQGSAAKKDSNTPATTPRSGGADESITPSNSVQPCRSLLRSFDKLADQLDKLIADINCV